MNQYAVLVDSRQCGTTLTHAIFDSKEDAEIRVQDLKITKEGERYGATLQVAKVWKNGGYFLRDNPYDYTHWVTNK